MSDDKNIDINADEFISEPTMGLYEKGKLSPPNIKKDEEDQENISEDIEEGSEPKDLSRGPVSNEADALIPSNVPNGQQLQKAIDDPSRTDQLCNVVRDHRPTSTVLKAIMEEIAEEAAFVKAWRNENWDTKTDISDATFKRVRMLQQLVSTLVEKEKLKREKSVGKIDFYSDNFQRIFKYFLNVIQKTFRDVKIPEQFEDVFFTKLAKEFDGFEKKAEKIYYNKR